MLAGVRGGLLFAASVPCASGDGNHPAVVSHAVRADVLLRCAVAQGMDPAPLVAPMLLSEGRLAVPAGGAAAALSFAAACGGGGGFAAVANADGAPAPLVVHAATLDAANAAEALRAQCERGGSWNVALSRASAALRVPP